MSATYSTYPSDDSCSLPDSWESVYQALLMALHSYGTRSFSWTDVVATAVVSAALFYWFAPRCWGLLSLLIFVGAVLGMHVLMKRYYGVDAVGEGSRQIKYMLNNRKQGQPTTTFRMARPATSILTSTLTPVVANLEGGLPISGPGRDIDSYPLDVNFWRAAPLPVQYQDFSQI